MKKFKPCLDWLIIGFLVQNFLLLIIVFTSDFEIRWGLLLAIPFIFWGIELLKENLGG